MISQVDRGGLKYLKPHFTSMKVTKVILEQQKSDFGTAKIRFWSNIAIFGIVKF